MMTPAEAATVIEAAKANNVVVTMEVAKADPVVSLVFLSPTGAYGCCTGEISDHKKPTAYMTCVGDNNTCQTIHLRERSDWHQCGKCAVHAKKKSKSANSMSLSKDPEIKRLQEELKAKTAELKETSKVEKKEEKHVENKAKKLAALKERLAAISRVATERGVKVSTQLITEVQAEREAIANDGEEEETVASF